MTTPPTSKADRLARRLDRLQGGILVLIVLVVGVMAGAASFTHVHDWTMGNSPAGTAGWFGWANAVISELIPTASLIIIARRRRIDPTAKIGYPMFLLLLAVSVSITAQLAVATPTLFGWIVSALPALAFLALSKLVFTATKARPTPEVAATQPTLVAPAPSTQDTVAAPTTRPAAAKKTTPAKKTGAPRAATTAKPRKTAASKAPVYDPLTEPIPGIVPATTMVEALLPGARLIAESHQDTHGQPITHGQLAARLKVSTALAKDVMRLMLDNASKPQAQHTAPHNGVPVTSGAVQ